MKNERLKAVLKFLFFLLLGVFLIWVTTKSLSSQEIEEVIKQLLNANFKILIPSIIIILFSHFIRALRWQMLIKPLSYQPGIINVFLSVLIGFFFNLVFPRLGELMKCTLLGKHEKIPVDKLVGTMVAERFVDVFCLVIVIVITIFSQYQRVGIYAKEIWSKFYTGIFNDLNRTIIGFLIVALILSALVIAYKKFEQSTLMVKVRRILSGILLGIVSIRKIEKKSLFILYTFLIWFFYLYCIKIGFLAINELSDLGWTPSLTILTFGSFAMIATQGGIGAYQLAVQKTLVLYEIKEVTGLAFGWLMWSVQTIFLMITGPLSILVMSIINKQRKTSLS